MPLSYRAINIKVLIAQTCNLGNFMGLFFFFSFFALVNNFMEQLLHKAMQQRCLKARSVGQKTMGCHRTTFSFSLVVLISPGSVLASASKLALTCLKSHLCL